MNAPEPPPVHHRLVVALAPAEAFALFTQGIARWWPFKGHSCSGEAAVDVAFEARVGGQVTELARDGARHAWGRLTAWDPPRHFAMTWHPGQIADRATVLAVRFTAVDGGCEVALTHGGWAARGDDAAEARDSYDQGWGTVLALYGQHAAECRQ